MMPFRKFLYQKYVVHLGKRMLADLVSATFNCFAIAIPSCFTQLAPSHLFCRNTDKTLMIETRYIVRTIKLPSYLSV